MRIDTQDTDEPEIGLIALIDCIFFLLMFFMVATSFKQQAGERHAQDLPVELPTAEVTPHRAQALPTDPLLIAVDKQGRFRLDGQAVGVQALRERLRDAAREEPRRMVRIEGDRRASYQHVVHVLDLCASEGLTSVSLRTLR